MAKKVKHLNENEMRTIVKEAVSRILNEINLQDFISNTKPKDSYELDNPFTAARSRDENNLARKHFGMDYDDMKYSDDELDNLGMAQYALQKTNHEPGEMDYADYPELKKAEMNSDWDDLDKASDELEKHLEDDYFMNITNDSDNSDVDKSAYYSNSNNRLTSWFNKNESRQHINKLIEEAYNAIVMVE